MVHKGKRLSTRRLLPSRERNPSTIRYLRAVRQTTNLDNTITTIIFTVSISHNPYPPEK